jgi:hypothetical protein
MNKTESTASMLMRSNRSLGKADIVTYDVALAATHASIISAMYYAAGRAAGFEWASAANIGKISADEFEEEDITIEEVYFTVLNEDTCVIAWSDGYVFNIYIKWCEDAWLSFASSKTPPLPKRAQRILDMFIGNAGR